MSEQAAIGIRPHLKKGVLTSRQGAAAVETGGNQINGSIVVEGISKYYRFHEKFHHKLEESFGEISSAVIKFGHYGPLMKYWT